MGLFSFLFGKSPNAAHPKAPDRPSVRKAQPAPGVQWREGSFPLEVVGESRYQDALIAICGKHTRNGYEGAHVATLIREPENAFDPNAVAVTISSRKVGYLERGQAARVTEQLAAAGLSSVDCGARVRGGWRTNQHDEGHYGVRLAVPNAGWIDLGIGAMKPEKAKVPRTLKPGLSPSPSGPLAGERVAMQGIPRDGELAALMSAAGAKILAGVGKTTTMLVVFGNKPFDSGTVRSATHQAALMAGVRIVCEAEIRDRLSRETA